MMVASFSLAWLAAATAIGKALAEAQTCMMAYHDMFESQDDNLHQRCNLTSICDPTTTCGGELQGIVALCEGSNSRTWDTARNRSARISELVSEEALARCGNLCYEALWRSESCDGCDGFCISSAVADMEMYCGNESFWEDGEEKPVRNRAARLSAVCAPGGCAEHMSRFENCNEGGLGAAWCNETDPCHQVGTDMMTTCEDVVDAETFAQMSMMMGSCGCLEDVRMLLGGACHMNPWAMCDEASTCHTLLSRAEAQCAGGPYHGMILELSASVAPLCSHMPCAEMLESLQEVCTEPSDICSEATPCGQRMEEIVGECADVETLTPALHLLRQTCSACTTRILEMSSATSSCSPESNHCDLGTACGREYGQMLSECRRLNRSSVSEAMWLGIESLMNFCGSNRGEFCVQIPREVAAMLPVTSCE